MTAQVPGRHEEMRRLRAAGLSLAAIGARLGVSRQRVAQVLGPDGRRGKGQRKARRPHLVIPPDLVVAYQAGKIAGPELARRLGVARPTVYAALRRQGVAVCWGQQPIPPLPPELVAAYRAREISGHQIARRLGVSAVAVYTALRRQGVEVRLRGPVPRPH